MTILDRPRQSETILDRPQDIWSVLVNAAISVALPVNSSSRRYFLFSLDAVLVIVSDGPKWSF